MTIDTEGMTFDRDQWGQLTLTFADGQRHVGIEPVRCFPLSDPLKSIALLDAEGHELLTLPNFDGLNPAARQFLETELASRDFVPIIERILATSNPHPPCQWVVKTDRGETKFDLESEDDVRKLGPHRILVADSNGIRYVIPDLRQLDAASKRIVQRLV